MRCINVYGAEYSQSVETFGKRGKRIRVAEFSIGIAEAELQQRTFTVTLRPCAVIAESEPSVRPDDSGSLSSVHASDNTPTCPLAAARGALGAQSFSSAVCC